MLPKSLRVLMVIVWSGVFWSGAIQAAEHAYRGTVDGMVCAFCAYNVSNKIGALPGVDASSVNVDLATGQVDLKASATVDKNTVSSVFEDSGFTLVEWNEVPSSNAVPRRFSTEALLSLSFSSGAIERLDPVLDAIGSLASEQPSRLSISAPAASEIALLKPILAGRKTVIKVQFVPVEHSTVELKVFGPVAGDKQ